MKLQVAATFAFLLAVLWTGCVVVDKRKALTFFFDGVPDLTSEENMEETPFALTANASGASDSPASDAQSKGWVHDPYANRDCAGCHDSAFSRTVTSKPKELCFQCHDDFIKGLAYIHGPVGAGECMTCHNPHKGEEAFGLTRLDQGLCLDCHESSDVIPNAEHDNMGDKSCLTCHDPHESNEKGLLRLVTTVASNQER